MDLEAQAKNAKIQAVRFFNEFEEVEKTANTALSNSISLQSELSTVQIDLKSLIESLQVNFESGVQNIQNQINEVTNVVVQEQEIRKSETEALQEQIFAQEDQLQKDVKGKQAKKVTPDSFAGLMRQKLRDKVKQNSGMLGLFGAGMGLAAFGGFMPGSGDETGDETGDGTGDKSLDFTGFTEENVGDNAFGFGSPFDTDLGIGDDAFGFGSFDTTEIIKNVTDEKNNNEKSDVSGEQQLLLTLEKRRNEIDDEIKLNKELLLEKDVSSITAERKTIEESINNLKLNKKDNKFGGNDYLQKLIKDKTSIKPILNNISNIGDEGLFDDIVNPKENNLNVGDMGFGFSNFDTDIFKIKDDNTSNNVIDGGTTVIEGGTEVVDGGTVGNNQRGEVRTSTSLVKSANSPVTAVKLSESNSIKELAIGA